MQGLKNDQSSQLGNLGYWLYKQKEVLMFDWESLETSTERKQFFALKYVKRENDANGEMFTRLFEVLHMKHPSLLRVLVKRGPINFLNVSRYINK